MAKTTAAFSSNEQNEVIIERREIVAQFSLSSHGTENPIIQAYREIGKYMADHDDPTGYEVTFNLWGREFSASVASAPSPGHRVDEDYN